MLFHGSCWTTGLGSSPGTGVSIAVCMLPLIGPGSHSFSKIVLEGANGAGAPGSATSVIGVEPIHPGSWQFPKLQEVKMNRWSNLLCNSTRQNWWVPATTLQSAAAPQMFPRNTMANPHRWCPTPNAATTTLRWCLGSHGTGKTRLSAHARQVTSR